jgi:hypothetical protein
LGVSPVERGQNRVPDPPASTAAQRLIDSGCP